VARAPRGEAGQRGERGAAIDQHDPAIAGRDAPAPEVAPLDERPDQRAASGLAIDQALPRRAVDDEDAIATGHDAARRPTDQLAERGPRALEPIDQRAVRRCIEVPRRGLPDRARLRVCGRERERRMPGEPLAVDRRAGSAERAPHDARECVDLREQRQAAPDVDEALDARPRREERTQRSPVSRGQPLVRQHEAIAAAGPEDAVRELDEVDVEVGDAIEHLERAQPQLVRDALLTDVRRIADHRVERIPR